MHFRHQMGENLMRAEPIRNLCGLMKRGLADPVNSQLVIKLRSGLRQVRNAVGADVNADSSIWWTFIEPKGLTKEASKRG